MGSSFYKEVIKVRCPKCKKEIKNVNVVSECWQKAIVNEKGKIIKYGGVEELLDTVKIEHRDNDCWADITKLIED